MAAPPSAGRPALVPPATPATRPGWNTADEPPTRTGQDQPGWNPPGSRGPLNSPIPTNSPVPTTGSQRRGGVTRVGPQDPAARADGGTRTPSRFGTRDPLAWDGTPAATPLRRGTGRSGDAPSRPGPRGAAATEAVSESGWTMIENRPGGTRSGTATLAEPTPLRRNAAPAASATRPAAAPPAAASGRAEPRHRLHPVTPLLKGLRMLVLVIGLFSWQGYEQLGPLRWGIGAILVLLGALAIAAVSWWTTGYQIRGRELRISEGVVWRRTRAIPLERLQTADLVKPALARLFGVAELRLEVVGAARAEAPLAYLSTPAAHRLREHLLALAGARGHVVAGQRTEHRTLHVVSNRRVLAAQLLTPHAWFVPVALAASFLPYYQRQPLTLSLVAVGSVATALIGALQAPVRRILDDWNFRIREDEAGLRLRHGLLSTRSQTVPRARIQAVGVTWPLMWRPMGWLKARMDVAGVGSLDREAMKGGVLLPVADVDTGRDVLAEVLGIDLMAVPISPAPDRARFLAPLRYRMLAIGHDGRMVYARDGWLIRRLVIAPLARAQSVRVVQGPLQRLLGLADVHIDTAGRLHVVGEHRDVREAYELAATLATAARAARARANGVHHASKAATTP